MNTERLFNVVILELTASKLKLEDNLEQTINSNEDIQHKTLRIKQILDDMSKIDNSITKLNSMLKNNNTEEKQD